MASRPVRIANCSGFSGDRRTALHEVLDGEPVDVVVGDYLAEVTLAGMVARTSTGRGSGWSPDFVAQLQGNLATLAERSTKLVVDAGAFDPGGLAEHVREMAAQEHAPLTVAHVEGDNLLGRLDSLQHRGIRLEHLDTGAPLSSWGREPLSANAYLGGWGIARALEAGADIVICPRVTDASMVVGAAAWWHRWAVHDWDRLAGAVTAGHIIECGPQATGGNFAGFTSIPDLRAPGFPIAEVAADGSAVITKQPGTGGAVTGDTVTAQLLYEIQGPIYLNPDVAVDLGAVRVEGEGPDRVGVSGAVGGPPPPTTKVAVTAINGYENDFRVYLTGLDLEEKESLVLEQVRHVLADSGVQLVRADRIGSAEPNPSSLERAMVALRIVGRAPAPEPLKPARFYGPVAATILGSIPGFHCESHTLRNTRASPVIEYWPALVPQEQLEHVVVFDDGSRAPAPVPPEFRVSPQVPSRDAAEPLAPVPVDESVEVPLGRIALARSGDKGGNSNVGIWAGREAWPWLRSALTVERFRALCPEAGDLPLARHEFPQLRAVHFVIFGNLAGGASSNGRLDALGKSLGEYVRARHVRVPRSLLE